MGESTPVAIISIVITACKSTRMQGSSRARAISASRLAAGTTWLTNFPPWGFWGYAAKSSEVEDIVPPLVILYSPYGRLFIIMFLRGCSTIYSHKNHKVTYLYQSRRRSEERRVGNEGTEGRTRWQ